MSVMDNTYIIYYCNVMKTESQTQNKIFSGFSTGGFGVTDASSGVYHVEKEC